MEVVTSQQTFSLFDATPQGLRRVQSPAVGRHHRDAKPAELQAAKDIAPKSGTQRHTILACVVEAGSKGITQWEVIVKTGILRSSVCGRMHELEEGEWVRSNGVTRRAGSLETKYFATTRGIKAIRQPSRPSPLKDEPAPQGVKANASARQGVRLPSPLEGS